MGSAEVQGDLWGKAPRDWAELQEPQHRPLWEAMLDEGNVGFGTRFLDAGCGGGGASVLAAQRGAKVSGLDAAGTLIEVARERVPDGDFRVGDIQELPFDDEAFDAVISASSLQYSEDRVATLREMKRVSARDGRVVVGLWSAPGKVEYRVVFEAVRETLPEPPPGKGPFELSGLGVLEDLIQQADMKVLGRGEAVCPFDYPDFETLWQVNVSAGPFQAAMQSVSEEQLKRAVWDAVRPYQASDGSIHMENWFRFVAATP
jgi:SAM-dependent methyltransferase